MSEYSLTIKKGKFQLTTTTTDSDFISEQFELWVSKSKEYAKQHKARLGRENALNIIKEETERTEQNIERQIASSKKDDAEPMFEEPVKKAEAKKIKETKEKEKEEKKEKPFNESNLDIFYAPPSETAFKNSVSAIANNEDGTPVFDSILEASVNNPSSELSFKPTPSIQKDNAFLNYMNSKDIKKKVDYLLLTAYYFSQYEQKPRFTLKQLNAKLMQNLAVLVDHGVLQEAINRNYIECLPDLTGLIGASEYRLTSYGEKVLFNE